MLLLPSGKTVNKNTPIYPGSFFSWGEATKDCSRPLKDLVIDNRMILLDNHVEDNIIRAAKNLDKVRQVLGSRPIHVNSWYRPQHINERVGGGKFSRHQYGDAVDIRSNYLSPAQIYKLLEPLHSMGGLSRYYNFVHIDWRGTKARW